MPNNKGITLIEVLVALLVISIGILGMLVLQLKGISGMSASQQRFLVDTVAYEIIDDFRLHRSQALNGEYDINGARVGTCTSTEAISAPERIKNKVACKISEDAILSVQRNTKIFNADTQEWPFVIRIIWHEAINKDQPTEFVYATEI